MTCKPHVGLGGSGASLWTDCLYMFKMMYFIPHVTEIKNTTTIQTLRDTIFVFSVNTKVRYVLVRWFHYSDIITSMMASQITNITIVHSTIYSGADQRKNESSPSLGFVRGIHRWPVNSPPKGPVMQKMFLFHDVIMFIKCIQLVV